MAYLLRKGNKFFRYEITIQKDVGKENITVW